jgi:hypothetical protein
MDDMNNEDRNTESLEKIAKALTAIGQGGSQPGALEFIGMTMRDGVRVTLDAGGIEEAINGVAESIRELAAAIRGDKP